MYCILALIQTISTVCPIYTGCIELLDLVSWNAFPLSNDYFCHLPMIYLIYALYWSNFQLFNKFKLIKIPNPSKHLIQIQIKTFIKFDVCQTDWITKFVYLSFDLVKVIKENKVEMSGWLVGWVGRWMAGWLVG